MPMPTPRDRPALEALLTDFLTEERSRRATDLEHRREETRERRLLASSVTNLANAVSDVQAKMLLLDQRLGRIEHLVDEIESTADETGKQELERLRVELERQRREHEDSTRTRATVQRQAVSQNVTWIIMFLSVVVAGAGVLVAAFVK